MQREEAISRDDTFDSLHDRLSLLGADVLLETIDGLDKGTLSPVPQNPALVSKAPKLQPGDGEIDWSQPAGAIHNHIRGLSSTPGAFTFRDGAKLKIFESMPIEPSLPGFSPGEPVIGEGIEGLVIAGATGWLRVLELQPAGKRRMKAEDYLRGYPLAEGEMWG
jgi:methionyl-tRNA formyltransferase